MICLFVCSFVHFPRIQFWPSHSRCWWHKKHRIGEWRCAYTRSTFKSLTLLPYPVLFLFAHTHRLNEICNRSFRKKRNAINSNWDERFCVWPKRATWRDATKWIWMIACNRRLGTVHKVVDWKPSFNEQHQPIENSTTLRYIFIPFFSCRFFFAFCLPFSAFRTFFAFFLSFFFFLHRKPTCNCWLIKFQIV